MSGSRGMTASLPEPVRGDARARARRWNAASYRAFLISGVNGRAHSLNVETGRLLEAVDAAKVLCSHKDMLAIRETGEDGKVRVHIYAIKRKSTPSYEYRDHRMQRINTLYADPVCVLAGEVLG